MFIDPVCYFTLLPSLSSICAEHQQAESSKLLTMAGFDEPGLAFSQSVGQALVVVRCGVCFWLRAA